MPHPVHVGGAITVRLINSNRVRRMGVAAGCIVDCHGDCGDFMAVEVNDVASNDAAGQPVLAQCSFEKI